MRTLLIRFFTFLLCFSTGFVLPLRTNLVTRHSLPLSSLKASIKGEDPLTQRLKKLGNLPEHDEDETRYFNCEFVNDRVGWLANGAKLWRTADGGATWKLIYSKGKTSFFDAEYIRHLQFVSPRIGWMLVDEKLYRTNDGGDTWFPLSTPKMEFVETFDFLRGGQIGWIGGTTCVSMQKDEGTANRFYCPGEGRHGAIASVFMTRDGGRTWHDQHVTRRFGDIGFIKMRDSAHGLAIGQAGVFRYKNGNWLDAVSTIPPIEDPELTPGEYCLQVEVGMPTFCPVNFKFTDAIHGYLSNTNGYFGRTSDGGRTWVDISHCEVEGRRLDPAYFSSFMIAQDGQGIARDSEGCLQETFDGGVTWDQLSNEDTFLDLFALSPDEVWVIKADGVYRLNPEKFGER